MRIDGLHAWTLTTPLFQWLAHTSRLYPDAGRYAILPSNCRWFYAMMKASSDNKGSTLSHMPRGNAFYSFGQWDRN